MIERNRDLLNSQIWDRNDSYKTVLCFLVWELELIYTSSPKIVNMGWKNIGREKAFFILDFILTSI